MISARRSAAAAGALLAAGVVALAAPASAAECEGGVSAPVKPLLHELEGPVAGTPGETVIHTVECTLP